MGNSVGTVFTAIAKETLIQIAASSLLAILKNFNPSINSQQITRLKNSLENISRAFLEGREVVHLIWGVIVLAAPNRDTRTIWMEMLQSLSSQGFGVFNIFKTPDAPPERAFEAKEAKEISEEKKTEYDEVKKIIIETFQVDPTLLGNIPSTLYQSLLLTLSSEEPSCCITLEPILNDNNHITQDVTVIFQESQDSQSHAITYHAFLYRGAALREWFESSNEVTNPLTRSRINANTQVFCIS